MSASDPVQRRISKAMSDKQIVIFPDTPPEVENAINSYNLLVSRRREQKHKADKLYTTFVEMNGISLAVIFVFLFAAPTDWGGWLLPSHRGLCFAVFAAYVAVAVVFGLFRKMPIVVTVASIGLGAIHWVLFTLTIANFLACFDYIVMLLKLKGEPDYPRFRFITVYHRQHGKDSSFLEQDIMPAAGAMPVVGRETASAAQRGTPPKRKKVSLQKPPRKPREEPYKVSLEKK